MAGVIHSEVHEKNVDIQAENVSNSSGQDENVITTQVDDPVERVSASTIMAIIVSLNSISRHFQF